MTASHNELDLESLEQLTRGTHNLGKTIVADCPNVNGCVVLSTCNRFEVYLDVDLPADVRKTNTEPAGPPGMDHLSHAKDRILELIAQASGATDSSSKDSFIMRADEKAVEHLFKVASGLDSLVVGEREIAGQVRKSLHKAHEDDLTTPALERLFQKTLNASKRVANQTQLAANGRSVVSVALDLAQLALPAWASASTLVVGTGAYAGATVAALRARGVRHISVYSGSGRAQEFAESHNVLPVEELIGGVSEADLVVCCSGTGNGMTGAATPSAFSAPSVFPGARVIPEPSGIPADATPRTHTLPEAHSTATYVLNAASIVASRDLREQREEPIVVHPRKLVVIDLALHKDADPLIADLSSVLFIDLETVRLNAPAADSTAVTGAERVLLEAVEEFQEGEERRVHDEAVKRIVAGYAEQRAALIGHLTAQGMSLDGAQKEASKRLNSEMHKEIVALKNA